MRLIYQLKVWKMSCAFTHFFWVFIGKLMMNCVVVY